MKKIFLFIIGFFLIPTIMGGITVLLFNPENQETYISFWGSIYLLIYILFPFIFRGKIKQSINQYAFFAIIYTLLFLILCIVQICFN